MIIIRSLVQALAARCRRCRLVGTYRQVSSGLCRPPTLFVSPSAAVVCCHFASKQVIPAATGKPVHASLVIQCALVQNAQLMHMQAVFITYVPPQSPACGDETPQSIFTVPGTVLGFQMPPLSCLASSRYQIPWHMRSSVHRDNCRGPRPASQVDSESSWQKKKKNWPKKSNCCSASPALGPSRRLTHALRLALDKTSHMLNNCESLPYY